MNPVKQPSSTAKTDNESTIEQISSNRSESITMPDTNMQTSVPRAKGRWLEKITQGMSLYGLELALSTVGLLVTLGVLTYGVFALINYGAGIEDPMAQQFMGEFSLWVAAMMVVWLPLTVIFYLRARHETDRNPASEHRFLHKFVVGLFMFNLIVTFATLVFTIVYSLIRMAVGIDDQAGDTALRVVLPSVLSAVVTAGFLAAYNRTQILSRKLFLSIVVGLSVVITAALLFVSVSTVQGSDRDQKASSDLSEISSEVENYYRDKNSLPSTLGDLNGLKSETKNRLSRYRYIKETGTHYQLCATFATDTNKSNGYEAMSKYSEEYSTYANFDSHGTGEKCFKLAASYIDAYNQDYTDYFNSSSPYPSTY
ncbi:MAG: hypothetical protein WBB39_01295 [Candidatus Saccharimonadales bacterium]